MIGKIDKKSYNGKFDDFETAYNRLNTQRYALQMGRFFRSLSCDFNGPPIFFLPPVIYQLKDPYTFNGIKTIYAEPEIDMDAWQKLTNNWTHCESQVMASFTHFTEFSSGGLFMITDL